MNFLVVEDDFLLSLGLKHAFTREGYKVFHAEDGVTADAFLRSTEFDLVLLDLGLPKMDGLDVLRGLRRRRCAVPVLVLTARDGVDQQIAALDAGADDYMEKPFDLRELLARVRALLRRSHAGFGNEAVVGPLVLDIFRRDIRLNGETLLLPTRELEVLEALMLNAPRIVSKSRLAQRLAQDNEDLGENAVEVYIHRLRRRLTDSGVSIRTVRGRGYLLAMQEDPECVDHPDIER
jgi:two-component system OmpR family response regulator